jgi:hypothetical protein
MQNTRARLQDIMQAIEAGRGAAAVPELVAISAALAACGEGQDDPRFALGFAWKRMAESVPEGRAALARMRDEHAQRLLAGDGRDLTGWLREPSSGFGACARIDDMLDDSRATRELFVRLLKERPELLAQDGWRALPALIDAGDFELAEPYLGDPLAGVATLNADTARFPLWPPREAPALALALRALVHGLRLKARVLDGLGRAEEARQLVDDVLTGLANEELCAAARTEWADPGWIMRELTRRDKEYAAASKAAFRTPADA